MIHYLTDGKSKAHISRDDFIITDNKVFQARGDGHRVQLYRVTDAELRSRIVVLGELVATLKGELNGKDNDRKFNSRIESIG